MNMYDYDGLEKQLSEKGISKTALGRKLGISSRTMARIGKGEKLSQNTLQKIADYLSCDPSLLYRIVSDNLILQQLRDEKDAKISGGLYHELQVRMTYNSNHMEGSQLSEEQTRLTGALEDHGKRRGADAHGSDQRDDDRGDDRVCAGERAKQRDEHD